MIIAKYLFLILTSEGSSDTRIFRNQFVMEIEFLTGLIVYTLLILHVLFRTLVNAEWWCQVEKWGLAHSLMLLFWKTKSCPLVPTPLLTCLDAGGCNNVGWLGQWERSGKFFKFHTQVQDGKVNEASLSTLLNFRIFIVHLITFLLKDFRFKF